MKKYVNVIFVLLVAVAIILFAKKGMEVMQNGSGVNKSGKQLIVVDAGHGGKDPGKVGGNNSLEKDINLAIAFKLKDLLEKNDFEVLMTRTEDMGLYQETDRNKKSADMRNRVALINGSGAVLAVSIHQNSFEQASSTGAQAFYHKGSVEARKLAEILQEQIKSTIADGNHRKAKANENYYMLKKTQCPLVIVECGFLSNQKEEALLCDSAYQEKMAWAIHIGIIQYLKNQVE